MKKFMKKKMVCPGNECCLFCSQASHGSPEDVPSIKESFDRLFEILLKATFALSCPALPLAIAPMSDCCQLDRAH